MFNNLKSIQTGECEIKGTFSFPPFISKEDMDKMTEKLRQNLGNSAQIEKYIDHKTWDYGLTRGNLLFNFIFDYPAGFLLCEGCYPGSIINAQENKSLAKDIGKGFEKIEIINSFPVFTIFLKKNMEVYDWDSNSPTSLKILPGDSYPRSHFYDIRTLPLAPPDMLFASQHIDNKVSLMLEDYEKGWIKNLKDNPDQYSIHETNDYCKIINKTPILSTIITLDKSKDFLPIMYQVFWGTKNDDTDESYLAIKIITEYEQTKEYLWFPIFVSSLSHASRDGKKYKQEVNLNLQWKSFNKPISKDSFDIESLLPYSVQIIDKRLPNSPLVGTIRKNTKADLFMEDGETKKKTGK
ncbi:MAG: hypothetical protein LBE13_00260 [Bacteroidales bacterium]|nr:hypothetical protein [Bacteroidales bacterium]